MSDLTTLQWARLLDRGEHVRISTTNRVAEGSLRSVGRREITFDYAPGTHEAFPLGVRRQDVRKVWKREGRTWRRIRSRR